MTVGLWEIAIALVFLPINALIFIARRDQGYSLTLGAKVFTGLACVFFIVVAFAIGTMAGRMDLHPHQYEWPDH